MGNRKRKDGKGGSKKNKEELSSSKNSEEIDETPVTGLTIEELPPEILMEILKFVDTRSLFKSRLVNRFWCRICSGILRQRPETEVKFDFPPDTFTIHSKNSVQAQTLQDFIACSKDSRNWPFARLNILDDNFMLPNPKYFDGEDWTRFLSHYDISTVKFLRLRLLHPDDEDSVLVLTEKLKDLLLDKFLHLEELNLNLEYCDNEAPRQNTVFPQQQQTTAQNFHDRVQHGSSLSLSFLLPHLKVIHFQNGMFSFYPQISKHLLNAGVNLTKIYLYDTDCGFAPEVLEFLHSQGKLHLLQRVEIQFTERFLSTVKKYMAAPFPFKLKELKLSTNNSFDRPTPSSWEEATRFLSLLFETCTDSLRKLRMEPLGVLHGLEFSRFKNLKELKLENYASTEPFFPAGITSLDIFPAVNRLDLEWITDWRSGFLTEESTPRLPSVKILSVTNRGITRNSITVLALLCPNLQDFQIKRVVHYAPRNFVQVGRAIWTHMTQLKSLQVDIDDVSTKKSLAALSSCFTGILEKDFRRLDSMKKAAGTLKKHGVAVKIPKSKLKVVRKHASILDMKDLRNFKVRINLMEMSMGSPMGTKAFGKKLA